MCVCVSFFENFNLSYSYLLGYVGRPIQLRKTKNPSSVGIVWRCLTVANTQPTVERLSGNKHSRNFQMLIHRLPLETFSRLFPKHALDLFVRSNDFHMIWLFFRRSWNTRAWVVMCDHSCSEEYDILEDLVWTEYFNKVGSTFHLTYWSWNEETFIPLMRFNDQGYCDVRDAS